MIFTKQMIKILNYFINKKIFEVSEIKFLKYEDKKTYFKIIYLNNNYIVKNKTVYINSSNEVIEEA